MISFLDILLLVYRNGADFCGFFLILKLYVICLLVLEDFWGGLMVLYVEACHLGRDTILPFLCDLAIFNFFMSKCFC